MNSNDFYNSLKDQLELAMDGAQSLSEEANSHIRLAVSNLFEKLDIVNREEFEAQTAVLKRSREKIDQLEQQLKELEESIALGDKDSGAS